jgi:hypothetical protein
VTRGISSATRRRPAPPADLLASAAGGFRAAPELADFVASSFLSEVSPLYNPDHAHLREARIGYRWTTFPYTRQQRPVAGTAQPAMPPRTLSGWDKALWEFQTRQLFGVEPASLDFIITLYAPACAEMPDADFCATVDHELYHCAQKRERGAPKFSRSTGRPVFCILGHDCEEFTGIVRRYGAGAAAGGTAELAAAARLRPSITPAQIRRACGTLAQAA